MIIEKPFSTAFKVACGWYLVKALLGFVVGYVMARIEDLEGKDEIEPIVYNMKGEKKDPIGFAA